MTAYLAHSHVSGQNGNSFVAGGLKLLDRIPGWAMGFGQKPFVKLGISIAIDVAGGFVILVR
jgi:hypothetical protein